MATFLLTETYFKEQLPVNLNIDFKEILASILVAQTRYVEDTLGTNLYNVIVNNVTANTLSGNYLTLTTEYIQPVVLWGGLYESLPFMQFKITNQGIITRVSENGTPATDDQFKYLRETIKNNSEEYQNRLRKYLMAATSNLGNLFPEYNINVGRIDYVHPRRRHIYTNGIYLGNGGVDDCLFGMDFPEQQHPII